MECTSKKKSGQYVSAKKWGENHKIAFNHIKKAICSLLDAAAKGDIEKVNSNNISAMFKGKLLAVYFPEIFAPIYSLTHLKYFVSHLNLKGNYLSGAEMQIAIMEYRNLWRELKEVFPCVFMFFLYQLFGSPASPLIRELDGEQGLPLLDEAIKGASFIDYMPPIIGNTGISDVASQRRQESNDGGQRFKVIGDRGEEIVLELEKQRLRNEKLYGLVNKVKHVAQFDDSAGFDILSYDNDGRERFIEVKSTVAQSIERGFYLTSNEYSKATTLDNYYIYFVFMACSKHPQVYPLCKPFSQRNKFNLRPVKYHVTGTPDNLLSGPRSGKRKKNQQRI